MSTRSLYDEFQKRIVPVRHVMFVVHGIGPSIGNGGYFLNHIENLKSSLAEVQGSKFEEEGAIEILPIEWHNVLHELVDSQISSVSLPTCQFIRSVNNNILSDVLFYFTKHHGQVIIETITNALNSNYEEFMKENPDYDGTFSLVGYSLGGVCCYDILAHQERIVNAQGCSKVFFDVPKLKFQPSNFFALGSPIGLVMVMRNQKFNSYQVPKSCVFDNIFHPYDPVGYRIEPLIEERYNGINPHPIEFSQENRFPFRLPTYDDFVFVNVTSKLALPSFPSVNPPQMIDKMLDGLNRQINAVLGFMSIMQHFRRNSQHLAKSVFKKERRITFTDTKRIMRVKEDKELGIDVITLLPKSDRKDTSLEHETQSPTTNNFVAQSVTTPSVELDHLPAENLTVDISVITRERCDTTVHSPNEDNQEQDAEGDTLMSESIYYCENGRELTSSFMVATSEEEKTEITDSWMVSNAAGHVTQKIYGVLKRMSSSITGLNSKPPSSNDELEEVCYRFSDQPEFTSEPTLMTSPAEAMESIFNELYIDTERNFTVPDGLSPMIGVTVDSCCESMESSPIIEDPLPFKQHPYIKHRIDFVLQENFMDYVSHQYVLGSRAHFSYWSNRDVAYHILKRVL
ncbi:hypothetical protein K7432_010830 [Basidiobolus ranarum]|uniref:DDHD domain-containing protein n=1 Tax=Basidiobolus ranarum TaxID=34480 RepID=A0ABR2WN62_9FUNG